MEGGKEGGIKLWEGEESQYRYKQESGRKTERKKGPSSSFSEIQSPPNLAA